VLAIDITFLHCNTSNVISKLVEKQHKDSSLYFKYFFSLAISLMTYFMKYN